MRCQKSSLRSELTQRNRFSSSGLWFLDIHGYINNSTERRITPWCWSNWVRVWLKFVNVPDHSSVTVNKPFKVITGLRRANSTIALHCQLVKPENGRFLLTTDDKSTRRWQCSTGAMNTRKNTKMTGRKYYNQARLSLKFSLLSLAITHNSWPKTRFSVLVLSGQFFVSEAQRASDWFPLSKFLSNAE